MSASIWSSVIWDVARAGGMMAYVLLTISVALGLALSLRLQGPRWPRLITNELHNFMTGLALVFIAVHGVGLLLDPYMRFTWQEIFVPLASHYRPLWTALGIVALYLALAVWLSTQLRAHIGYAVWRRLHVLTFAVYVLSTLHGIGTGTDTRTPWALGLYAGSVLLVGALLELRLLRPVGTRGTIHPRLAALSAAAIVAGATWTVMGPLHSTGTASPTTAAPASAASQSTSGQSSSGQSTAALTPFSASLQGTFTQSQDNATGAVTLRWDMTLGDGSQRPLTVIVQGEPAADGSLSVTTTRVTLGAGAGAPAYTGTLSSLRDDWNWRMGAVLTGTGTDAPQLSVRITLQQTDAGGQVSGVVDATPTSTTTTGNNNAAT